MASTSMRIVALGLIVVAAGAGGYWLSRPESTPPILGVVRATEVRIAPEVDGQLAAIKVHKGDTVRASEVVAELSAIELTASVGQARAALAAATADRNNVDAGVRAEQVASLKAEIAKAKSRLEYAEQQLSRTDTLPAVRTPRSRRSTRRKTTRRAPGPTSPRQKPTTTRQSPGRRKRSAPSRTRWSRRRSPRSRCSNGTSTRRSSGRRPTALSAWSSPRSARTSTQESRCS